MESKNIFQRNTCNVQQIAVISKIHNMQWLKNNPPLSGHIKQKSNKGITEVLKEDLKTSELKPESTMSVPTDNLPLINSTKIVSTTNENKYNCDSKSDIDESSVILESKESIKYINNDLTNLDQQLLILQELEQDKMISMAIHNSLLSLEMETNLKSEEEEKIKKQDAVKSDLKLLKTKDCTSDVNQKDIHDNNNNNNSNISQPDLKISNILSDTSLSKGTDRENKSNNYLNTETDASINLSNPKEILIANDDEIIPISPKISKNNAESKIENKCDLKQLLEKKEVPKVISKNAVPTNTYNKKNNVIVDQSTESKTKYEIKQSIKSLSTEVIRMSPDKKNHQPNQSILNTSKVIKNKCNLQPKKETVVVKHSTALSTRHTTNLTGSEQNKSTSLNTFNRQYRVNRMCYASKKEESESASKTHNHLSKTMQYTIKGLTNSNLPNSTQSTKKQASNISRIPPNNKNVLKTSDEDIHQRKMLTNNEIRETLKEECVNKTSDTNKTPIDIIDKEINTSSNDVKGTGESNIQDLRNGHSTNECIKPKVVNSNPFMEDVPNLPTSNKLQICTNNCKDVIDNNLGIKGTQLDNIPLTNIPNVYHVPQQNVPQEQAPSNFIRYIPDQFVMNCSANPTLPKFPSNTSYSNASTINQYGNTQTFSNVPLNSQLQNCSSSNILPVNTVKMNTLQYPMPNVLPCSSQNVIRPPPNFCIHPMSQEEQLNLPTYGLNPAYFMNPMCVCRNEFYPSQPQNWNVPHNYPVLLQHNPYSVNYSPFCNQHVQSNNINHKKTTTARPDQGLPQAQILHEQNLQRNYGKPVSNFESNIKNPQNNKTCDAKIQVQKSISHTQHSTDLKIEKSDGEFLSDKEGNNLPMISPKACMIYGSGLPTTNFNTIKPQMKYGETIDSVSNCPLQYQRNNEYYNISSKARLPPDRGMGRGKTRLTHQSQQSYKAQY